MNIPSTSNGKKRKPEDGAARAALEQSKKRILPSHDGSEDDEQANADDEYARMLEEKKAYNRRSSARSRLRTKERIADFVALSEKQAQKIAQLEEVNIQLVEQIRVLTAEHQRREQILQERSAPQQQQSIVTNSNLQLLIESLTKKALAERILQSQISAIRPDGRQAFPSIPATKSSFSRVADATSNGTSATPAVAFGSLLPGDSIIQTYNAFLTSLARK